MLLQVHRITERNGQTIIYFVTFILSLYLMYVNYKSVVYVNLNELCCDSVTGPAQGSSFRFHIFEKVTAPGYIETFMGSFPGSRIII